MQSKEIRSQYSLSIFKLNKCEQKRQSSRIVRLMPSLLIAAQVNLMENMWQKIGWELAFFESNLLKQLFSKDSIKITIFDIKSSKKEPKQVKYVNWYFFYWVK